MIEKDESCEGSLASALVNEEPSRAPGLSSVLDVRSSGLDSMINMCYFCSMYVSRKPPAFPGPEY